MDQVSTLERLFKYKAHSNDQILAAMRGFDDASPAKEIVIRILNHTYVVDRIFAANLNGTEHGYTSANTNQAPSLEELSATIKASDHWYINYVSLLDNAQLAEKIDFTFTDGEPGCMSREEMLMHVAIHVAGHRGQIGLLMMQNSITPPVDRFTSYLHKAEASTGVTVVLQATRLEAISRGGRPNNLQPAQQAVDETPVQEGKAISPLDELTERMKRAVDADSGLGKRLKFNLKGEGSIYIDGGSVTNQDKPAELTLTLTIDDMKAMSQGKLAPMTAMMSGHVKLSDVGIAANLQGKMQALFSKMQTATSQSAPANARRK